MDGAVKVVAFDMIGTTFSLEPVRESLCALGLPTNGLELWFALALRDACALAASDSFQPFATILQTALTQVLNQSHLDVTPDQITKVLDGLKRLPPQAEARRALETVKAAGHRTLVLTNGAEASARALLDVAELTPLVDRLISVDEVGALKPRREVYRYAAAAVGVAVAELALVSTHAWDVHGAKSAGLVAGFVARGQTFPSTMQQPDIIGADLSEVAHRLCALTQKPSSSSWTRQGRTP